MAGSALPTDLSSSSTGHIAHSNAVHAIVNKFDKDAVPADNQVLTWDATTNLYVPEAPAGGGSVDESTVRTIIGNALVQGTDVVLTVSGTGTSKITTIAVNTTSAYINGLIAAGGYYTVMYNGSSWPALSTVPAAYISSGRAIIWDSQTYSAATAPAEARNNDFWDKNVEP